MVKREAGIDIDSSQIKAKVGKNNLSPGFIKSSSLLRVLLIGYHTDFSNEKTVLFRQKKTQTQAFYYTLRNPRR